MTIHLRYIFQRIFRGISETIYVKPLFQSDYDNM